ncbi:MAG: hypothetical protein E4H29_01275 [Deltaproteobacteria bacterium]|nr:MAG: hypothetical protein E4H29_01275 [Deltaproteobacteria bacterium]
MKSRMRIDWREVAGSFGDLATFLPLALGLITVNGMNPTSLFLSAGAMYISAGLYFRLPIPVQPLKATSAIAIAIGASPGTISMVAFLMGGISFSRRCSTSTDRSARSSLVRSSGASSSGWGSCW